MLHEIPQLIVGERDMHATGLISVMNSTKWEELRLAMYALGDLHPKWCTKDIETGFIPEWEGEWFYHFRDGEGATGSSLKNLQIVIFFDKGRIQFCRILVD